MSESFDNVIGGGLALKGGLTLRKPAKRKKAHKKKEKKHKKSDKADKKRSKKDKKKDRRVHFESGELDDGAEAESTALTLIDEGSAAGDDDDTQIAETSSGGGGAGGGGEKAEAYDPLNDPNLTETQRKHLLAQRKRYSNLADRALKLTHRQRIEKFNTMLANLSEHHDVPKVGNAGMG